MTNWNYETETNAHTTYVDSEVLTLKMGNYTAKIVQVSDGFESPREWDNIGSLWVGSNCRRNYSIGDNDQADIGDDEIETIIAQAGTVSLPVYMYNHNNERLSTTPFSCQWDSGLIGFIYVTSETIASDLVLSNTSETEIKELLNSEIETLDSYVSGEIYGFTIIDNMGSEVDSCYGYYGLEHIKSEVEMLLKNLI